MQLSNRSRFRLDKNTPKSPPYTSKIEDNLLVKESIHLTFKLLVFKFIDFEISFILDFSCISYNASSHIIALIYIFDKPFKLMK